MKKRKLSHGHPASMGDTIPATVRGNSGRLFLTFGGTGLHQTYANRLLGKIYLHNKVNVLKYTQLHKSVQSFCPKELKYKTAHLGVIS